MAEVIRSCGWCGDPLPSPDPRAQFCCHAHKLRAWRARHKAAAPDVEYRTDTLGRVYPARKNRRLSAPAAERVWEQVEFTETCWLWTGGRTKAGYGQISEGRSPRPTKHYVHRLAWETLVGPIPEGMTIDHVAEVCRNRHCVNVDHMEVVTRAENGRRGGVLGGRSKALVA